MLTACCSDHFKEFFTRNAHYEKNGEPEYVFNWTKLRDLQKSFLDSIIVELCLPDSRIPKNILYLLLREAVDEASKKAKEYFPQALWDAVGDLSVSHTTGMTVRLDLIDHFHVMSTHHRV